MMGVQSSGVGLRWDNKDRKINNMAQQGKPTMQGFGPRPQTVHCSRCRQDILTVVESNSSGNNGCMGIILCLLGCIRCALYMWMCADDSTELTHSCPTCG